MGPVQVVVVGFDEPTFSGEVLAELTRLGDAGIVRLVDVLLVARGADGTLETVEPPAPFDEDYGRVAAAFLGQPDGEGDGDPEAPSWSLADVVPAGSTAAVALIEHVWAGPLMNAIGRSGGTALEESWLTPADVATLELLLSSSEPRTG